MTPNTDSREQELEEIIRFNINAPLIADARIKDLVNALSDYTANKQREVLEWVEQEVVGADDKPNIDNAFEGRNRLRAFQREELKNKKESLS